MLTRIEKAILITVTSAMLLILANNYNVVNGELLINDPHLKIQKVTQGLNSPTSMAFLGPNDILVLEKDGKVLRVIGNKILKQPVLDITSIVVNMHEAGLLGIVISTGENDESQNGKDQSRLNVYLFFTEMVNNKNPDTPCQSKVCASNEYYAVNSLYRYKIKAGELVNGTRLLSLPIRGSDFQHIGGAIALSPDNDIFIPTGDGYACLNYEQCKKSVEEGALNSQTANSRNGSTPLGMGGILFLPNNGAVAEHRGVLGDHYPLNLYYAYGIRNSFGIDFDPLSGKLWDTENGPLFGDEINLVESGFNSGWAKAQGIWGISNYNQLSAIIDRPNETSKWNYFPTQKLENYNKTMFDFNGKGKYSEPEFTWNATVGVTSIKFFASDKLGKKYENGLFVGSYNPGGTLYHFELDGKRKGLVLNGQLEDKVADNPNEMGDVVFARNLGGISDLEVSPDGYLYILSIGKEAIYKIESR